MKWRKGKENQKMIRNEECLKKRIESQEETYEERREGLHSRGGNERKKVQSVKKKKTQNNNNKKINNLLLENLLYRMQQK